MSDETLFHDAHRMPAAERAAFLKKACGNDAALRRRLESLLQAHDHPSGLMAEPLPEMLLNLDDANGPVGQMIGRYKLLEAIGEGGFGTVYLAEQEKPVRRYVALKIVKLGMDTKQVIARFEAERQALAMMDHPNIAKVFDAGATDIGRPYFVMELVRGVPITDYCDANNLSVPQRLDLFVQVCHAVQHAHQKGIIHRDLKPSNVMVAMVDGQPTPKVIDFGIAKATNQQLTEKTIFTELRQMIGTPQYMSPEQAEMAGIDIDTRTDIYSLGVILYELLVGSTPFEPQDLRSKAYGEMQRMIREVDPPRPSTRLSTAAADLSKIAAHRRVEPALLEQIVDGELDWIVMKALEKDRNRRYATANELAADVKHFLADETVQACPPSARYRFGKFVRRYKRALATTALLGVTLITAIILLSLSYLRLHAAQKRTDSEYHRAEAQKVEADRERSEAEDRLDLVFNALDEMFLHEVEARAFLQRRSIGPQKSADPQREKGERQFLDRGIKFYERISQRLGQSPRAQAEIGRALRRVGIIEQDLGRQQESEYALRRSLQLFANLATQFPEFAEYSMEQANTLQGLYWPLVETGRSSEAEQTMRQAIALVQKLPAHLREQQNTRKWVAYCHNHIGRIETRTGRSRDAIVEFRAAAELFGQLIIELPQENRAREGLAENALHLANALDDVGQRNDAAASFADAANRYEQLLATINTKSPIAADSVDPSAIDSAWYRHELGYALLWRGGLLTQLRQFSDADAILNKGLDLHLKLVGDFPDTAEYKMRLTWNYLFVGELHQARGDRERAEESYRQAVAAMEPAGLNSRFLAGAYERLGNLYEQTERIPDALEARHKNVDCWEKLAASTDERDARMHLGEGYNALAKLCVRAEKYEAADGAYRKSLGIWQRMVSEQPKSTDYLPPLHQTYIALIDLVPHGAHATEWGTTTNGLSKSLELRDSDANDWFFLAVGSWQQGNKDDARKWYNRAIAWTDKNGLPNANIRRLREQAGNMIKD